jgi:hypothetical protein
VDFRVKPRDGLRVSDLQPIREKLRERYPTQKSIQRVTGQISVNVQDGAVQAAPAVLRGSILFSLLRVEFLRWGTSVKCNHDTIGFFGNSYVLNAVSGISGRRGKPVDYFLASFERIFAALPAR